MPVKRNWFNVEDIINTKKINGILHYGVKFYKYKKIYYTPCWDVSFEARKWYHNKIYRIQKQDRYIRYIRYRERKNAQLGMEWETDNDFDTENSRSSSSSSSMEPERESSSSSDVEVEAAPRIIRRGRPKW